MKSGEIGQPVSKEEFFKDYEICNMFIVKVQGQMTLGTNV